MLNINSTSAKFRRSIEITAYVATYAKYRGAMVGNYSNLSQAPLVKGLCPVPNS